GTFSGGIPGFSAGTYTLSLVYSIKDPAQEIVEIIRTSDITVTVVANEDTLADFSSTEMTYTDTDGDSFSNLDELKAGTSPFIPNYTVGGQVEGLTGSGLVLQNNGGDNLTISANGAFSFSLTAIDGDEYAVSVLTQPGNPNQTCTVNNGNGNISGAAISAVTVTCSTTSLEVSVSTVNIKTIRFEWSAYVGATSYKLLVNPDAASGFNLLQDNLSDTSTTITLPVHLTDWINARYILEAHNASGKLTESAPVSITALKLSSIGYFKASNTGAGDFFGWVVSLSGDGNTLAVGARLEDSIATDVNSSDEDDNAAADSGAVYVFSRNGGLWAQQAYIKASNTEANDQFGSAVSLSDDGNTLAVGAFGEGSAFTGISTNGKGEDDNTAENAGAVYVFSRSGATWSRLAYIKASNTGEGDQFGSIVSLSSDGDTLAVGASEEDSIATGISIDGSGEDNNTESNAGAVYVFSRNGTTWVQQAYVKASNAGTGDRFGSAVSLSDKGNMLAVGAFEEDSTATGINIDGGESNNTAENAGAVYVFSRNGTTWVQQAYVKASNTGTGDSFGQTVSLSGNGNMLVVGASGEGSAATGISTDGSGEDDNTAHRSGAVYIFGHDGGVWSQQVYVKASNTEAADSFGSAVSLSGDGNTLAVGAQQEGNSSSGAVYVFSHSGGIWSQESYVKASTIGAADRFGYAISLSGDGNTLAVGAFREDSAATDINTGGSTSDADNSASHAGAVYLY
ncbi:probable outer membrane secretion protein -Rhodobacter capsulatus, partial [hydrothermal vent metagenome]